MNKLDLKEINKKGKPNPLFKGFPSKLKDPKFYIETEEKINNILKSDHKHKTASQYAKCIECQNKREERKLLMKKSGFKSIQQYLEWKKIMNIIINKKSFQLK